jgi:precorrin-8X/cobalt-precorrin-8 methylmutase
MAPHVDHPIFTESIRRIRRRLGATGLDPLQQQVLERLVHSSGDPALAPLLRFSPAACERGCDHLARGGVILTDTAMAAAAVRPMARRTFANPVHCVLDWAPAVAGQGTTRAAEGLAAALGPHPDALVLIGSAPTALTSLVRLRQGGEAAPVLVVGMPVGFVGVRESKRLLARSGLPQIRLEGSRGGAALAAATVNALLRAAWLARDGASMAAETISVPEP